MLANDAGRFELTVARKGDKVTIARALTLAKARYEPISWPALRALLLAERGALARTVSCAAPAPRPERRERPRAGRQAGSRTFVDKTREPSGARGGEGSAPALLGETELLRCVCGARASPAASRRHAGGTPAARQRRQIHRGDCERTATVAVSPRRSGDRPAHPHRLTPTAATPQRRNAATAPRAVTAPPAPGPG